MRGKVLLGISCIASLIIGIALGFFLFLQKLPMAENFVLSEKLFVLSGIVRKFNAAPEAEGQLNYAVCAQIEAESMEFDKRFVEADETFDPEKTRDLLLQRSAILCKSFGRENSVAQ